MASKGAHPGKENTMCEEKMTDFQFKAILKMVLEILNGSKDIEEAKEKIQALITDNEKQ